MGTNRQDEFSARKRLRRALPAASEILGGSPSSLPSTDRIRATPHIERNYSTQMMLFINPQAYTERIHAIFARLPEALRGVVRPVDSRWAFEPPGVPVWQATPGSGPTSALHLSFSRTWMLRPAALRPLEDAVQQEGAEWLESLPSNLSLAVKSLRLLRNDDGSRTFVAAALEQNSAYDWALRQIAAADRLGQSFGLPPYYRPAIPHVSLWWAPTSSLPATYREVDCTISLESTTESSCTLPIPSKSCVLGLQIGSRFIRLSTQ